MWESSPIAHDPVLQPLGFLINFSNAILTDDSGNLLLLAG